MTPADPEIISVRPDEQLDTIRLEPYLKERLADAHGPVAVRQFGGGHANLTYLLRFDDTEYVLRRPPLGPVASSAHDMKREHRVQSALYKSYPMAPNSFLYCDDAAIIGAEFHVSERRHGIVIRSEIPERFAGDVGLNRRIGMMMIDSLADFHAVDPDAVGLSEFGHPEGFVQRQLDGWIERWQGAKDKDLPDIEKLILWLSAAVPVSEHVALVHNDFKLDNLLVDGDDPAKLVALLDWDMCTKGDPLMDLGHMLNYWSQKDDDPEWRSVSSMPTWHDGFPSRDEIIQRYARRTGFDTSRFDWYLAFGVFKLAVIVQQIYIRFLRGQTQDQRFADFGDRVAGLGRKGMVLTG